MAVVGSLTIRRVHRRTRPDGRPSPPTETTEYIQADRKREDHRSLVGYRLGASGRDIYRPGPRTARITRCDLQKTFLVNFDDREYATWPLHSFPTREEMQAQAAADPQPHVQLPPSVLIETETIDTGERREFFGRSARHVITTRHVIPLMGFKRTESRTV